MRLRGLVLAMIFLSPGRIRARRMVTHWEPHGWWWPALVLLVAVLSGCGGKNTPVRIEGIVTLDGKPVEGATILFKPEEADTGRPAVGMSDEDGVFRLTTFAENDGVLPGLYRVIVTKRERIEPPPDPPGAAPGDPKQVNEHYRQLHARSQKKRSLLPAVYGADATTPLRCTIPPDEKVILPLESKHGR